MTLDASASPSLHSGRARRGTRAEETLGVFSADGGWKVYSPFAAAAAYPSRREAIAAAEARAFAAVREGRWVELFVEHEDGSLALAPLGVAGGSRLVDAP